MRGSGGKTDILGERILGFRFGKENLKPIAGANKPTL